MSAAADVTRGNAMPDRNRRLRMLIEDMQQLTETIRFNSQLTLPQASGLARVLRYGKKTVDLIVDHQTHCIRETRLIEHFYWPDI